MGCLRQGRSRPLCPILLVVGSVARGLAQQPGGEVTGRVIDPSGTGLAGVTITIRSGIAQPRQALTGQAGQFQVTNLPDGTFDATFTLDGFLKETRRVIIRAEAHVDLGTVLLKLGPGGDISVSSSGPIPDLYIPVLNRLFRYAVDPVLPEVLLRFTLDCDCDHALEMQIVADRLTDGPHAAYRVTAWYLPSGSTNVTNRLLGLVNHFPDLSVGDLADRISVNHAAMTAAPETALAELFDGATALRVGRSAGPFESGMHYELTLRGPGRDFSVTVAADPTGPSDDPVVHWMRQVRKAVEAQLPKH